MHSYFVHIFYSVEIFGIVVGVAAILGLILTAVSVCGCYSCCDGKIMTIQSIILAMYTLSHLIITPCAHAQQG